MRCSCCDKKLTEYESTLKHAETGHFLDTCLDCLSDISKDTPMPVKGRKDLLVDVVIHDDVDELTEAEYNNYTDTKDNEE